MAQRSPWANGDLNDVILKFVDMGADPIVKTLETIREILLGLDRIENETARVNAAREASKNFAAARAAQQE